MIETMAIAEMQPVTVRIARLVESVPGWTPPDQLLALHTLAVATSHLGGDVMEIGSWCGRSTAVLGHAVETTRAGHVWAIDLFPHEADWRTNPDGTHSFSVMIGGVRINGYEVQTVWDEPYQRDIATVYAHYDSALEAFHATINAEGLDKTVTPFCGTSSMFAAQAARDLKIRFAFLDGDHSYRAVCADIEAVEQFLLPGGWIAFDDAFSVYEGVDTAIRERVISSRRYDCAHQMCRKLFVARRK